APKKIRKSCSSSGVPWKIWMKPVDSTRAALFSEVRARAMTRPRIAPPMKAIADSASVHLAASRMNRNSGKPKVRMSALQDTARLARRTKLTRTKPRNPADPARPGRTDCPLEGGAEPHEVGEAGGELHLRSG